MMFIHVDKNKLSTFSFGIGQVLIQGNTNLVLGSTTSSWPCVWHKLVIASVTMVVYYIRVFCHIILNDCPWCIQFWWIVLVLFQAVGIAVEFCSHIVHAFNLSTEETRILRAKDALVNTGSSVSRRVLRGNLLCFLKHNQQYAMLYNILYCCQCSTCFERVFRSSSEDQKFYIQHRILVKRFAATANVGE